MEYQPQQLEYLSKKVFVSTDGGVIDIGMVEQRNKEHQKRPI